MDAGNFLLTLCQYCHASHPNLLAADPSFFNYKVAITNLPLVRYYFNSLLVTAASTLGYLFFSSLTGYAFAKGRFVGKSVLFIILLTTLMIPFEIRMIPMYQLMRQLHLSDSYAALILPFISGGFGTFLMRQYISAIPDELIDAARVDGANELTIYARIVLPLCGPLAALTACSVRSGAGMMSCALVGHLRSRPVYDHVWVGDCWPFTGNLYRCGARNIRHCDFANHDPLPVPPALYHPRDHADGAKRMIMKGVV